MFDLQKASQEDLKAFEDYMHDQIARDKLNRLYEIEYRKYFEGFNVGKEKKMFKEELDDIEKIYVTALEDGKKEMDRRLNSLVHYFRNFLDHYDAQETIEEKLEALRAKLGKNCKKDCDEEENDDE